MTSMRRTGGASPPVFFATIACGLLFVPSFAFAFDKPKAYVPRPAPKIAPELDDVYDLLYLGKPRPVWFRLHVRVGGQPFSTRWDRYINALFDYFDVNGDGILDVFECGHLPAPQMLQTIVQSGYPFAQVLANPIMSQVDANMDARVTREEFAAFYRKKVNLIRIQPIADPDPYADGINRAIFRLLDTNGDGKLSRAELAAAEKLLDKYDVDEDECLTVQELIPNVLTAVNRQQTPPILNQYLLFRPGDPVTGLAQRFLDVYDLDKDYHLSREECPLDEPLFNRLDRDGNGQLDVPELAEFFSHAVPDLESWFNLDGQNAVGALSRFSFRPDSVTAKSIGRTVRVQLKGGESLDLGDPAMAVFNRGAARLNVRQSLTQSFKIVAGEKGYIDEKDVQAPNGRALQPYFVVGDRNGDGRLTMDELNAFIELHMKLPEATLSLSAFRQSVNWFAALDANRDGRLSRRELREAWKSLAALQESPGETISPPDKVDRLQLVIHQGTNIYFNAAQGYLNPQAPRPSSAGPLWFRKMDRNGDGFVSRREFLGTKEEFDRIDRDGDGLIDPDEAERATPRK